MGKAQLIFHDIFALFKKLRNELPPEVRSTVGDRFILDIAISSLQPHKQLAGTHTLLCAKFADTPQEVTFSYVENRVNLILVGNDDKTSASSKVAHEELIASLTTAYLTQDQNKRPTRGKFTSFQTRSPIKKERCTGSKPRKSFLNQCSAFRN